MLYVSKIVIKYFFRVRIIKTFCYWFVAPTWGRRCRFNGWDTLSLEVHNIPVTVGLIPALKFDNVPVRISDIDKSKQPNIFNIMFT